MSWTCDHIRRDSDSDIFKKKRKHLLMRRLSNELLKFPIMINFIFLSTAVRTDNDPPGQL